MIQRSTDTQKMTTPTPQLSAEDLASATIKTTKRTVTHAWDPANYLYDEEECALYLDAIIQEAEGDEKPIAAALGDIARAHGMMRVSREALYRSLSATGNPSFGTVLKVLTALGLELSVRPAQAK